MDKQSTRTLLASGLAGSIARLLLYPIDTVKAKIQVSSATVSARPGKSLQSALQTIRAEGVMGIYRGLLFSIAGTVPGFCTYMVVYGYAKREMAAKLPQQKTVVYLASGLIAEAVACLFFLPVDVIKERIQVQSSLKTYWYENARDAFRQILRQQGIRGLYRAYGATLAFFGPFSALYFMFYEHSKAWCCKDPAAPSFMASLLLSGISGSVASVLVTPLELSKLRMQVQRAESQAGLDPRFGYRNMAHGIWLIYKRQGFLALYRGAMMRVLFSAPMTALSMSLTEYFKGVLRSDIQ